MIEPKYRGSHHRALVRRSNIPVLMTECGHYCICQLSKLYPGPQALSKPENNSRVMEFCVRTDNRHSHFIVWAETGRDSAREAGCKTPCNVKMEHKTHIVPPT